MSGLEPSSKIAGECLPVQFCIFQTWWSRLLVYFVVCFCLFILKFIPGCVPRGQLQSSLSGLLPDRRYRGRIFLLLYLYSFCQLILLKLFLKLNIIFHSWNHSTRTKVGVWWAERYKLEAIVAKSADVLASTVATLLLLRLKLSMLYFQSCYEYIT